jgi:hypothetical protein
MASNFIASPNVSFKQLKELGFVPKDSAVQWSIFQKDLLEASLIKMREDPSIVNVRDMCYYLSFYVFKNTIGTKQIKQKIHELICQKLMHFPDLT